MTTRPVPIAAAVRDADRDYLTYDQHRDRTNQLKAIARMTAGGMSHREVGKAIGHCERSVTRLASQALPKPRQLSRFDRSERRCRRLEDTATVAAQLACRLRDDDPRATWDALGRLNRTALQELAVVLLAAMPIDRPMSATFGWVIDLGTEAVSA